MNERQWRSVVVDQRARLSYALGALKIKNKDGNIQRIPLYNVSAVMIATLQARISSCLIDQLRQRNISLIFCDSGKMPAAEIVGYSQPSQTSARLKQQIQWTPQAKVAVWERIIQLKLTVQQKLLVELGAPFAQNRWNDFISQSDASQCPRQEGLAARTYFRILFGKEFHRFGKNASRAGYLTADERNASKNKPEEEDIINRALNYGYAVLRSAMTRALTIRGFNPALGVCHCSGSNPFNLTYDLIEPFRPFVDRIVYRRRENPFDWEFKRNLIAVLNEPAVYKRKTAELSTIMEYYLTDVVRALKNGDRNISTIDFK